MFILSSTQRRINIDAPFTTPDGVTYANLRDPAVREQLGVQEIADPLPPEDYSDETYYRTEQDDAPYVVYTRKSDEQIEQARRARALARIAALEDEQLRQTARMVRERTLKEAEDLALAQFGLTPEQLYALGSQPNPETAALTYKRLKDLDNAIKAERESVA